MQGEIDICPILSTTVPPSPKIISASHFPPPTDSLLRIITSPLYTSSLEARYRGGRAGVLEEATHSCYETLEQQQGRGEREKNLGMGVEDMMCDAGLLLGLGFEGWASTPAPADRHRKRERCVKLELRETPRGSPPPVAVEPSLTLSLSDGAYHRSPAPKRAFIDVNAAGSEERRLQAARQSPPHSMVSSFSNAYPSSSIKKEKDVVSEEVEAERVSSRVSDEEEGSARKKLRLTKEQSALLEDRFKEHSTLNPKQKQALAKQLNLRPRQVEVWFQNRRARTKLKQTEVDCEYLKRCCENLSDENRRLQKELQELRALTFPQPLYMQLPAATLTVCPSCERMAAAAGDAPKGGVAAGGPFVMAPKPHFYNPFSTAHPPSAAC